MERQADMSKIGTSAFRNTVERTAKKNQRRKY